MREFDFKAGGHAVECFAIDAEDFGGALAVVAGGVEDVEDVAALDFVEVRKAGKKFGEIVCRERRRVVRWLQTNARREIFHRHNTTLIQGHCTLDHVFEFTHIAGP